MVNLGEEVVDSTTNIIIGPTQIVDSTTNRIIDPTQIGQQTPISIDIIKVEEGGRFYKVLM